MILNEREEKWSKYKDLYLMEKDTVYDSFFANLGSYITPLVRPEVRIEF